MFQSGYGKNTKRRPKLNINKTKLSFKMSSIIKKSGPYTVSMFKGHSYYAYVNKKCAEWYCFGICTPGNYKITCNGENDYTIVEENPPEKSDE